MLTLAACTRNTDDALIPPTKSDPFFIAASTLDEANVTKLQSNMYNKFEKKKNIVDQTIYGSFEPKRRNCMMNE